MGGGLIGRFKLCKLFIFSFNYLFECLEWSWEIRCGVRDEMSRPMTVRLTTFSSQTLDNQLTLKITWAGDLLQEGKLPTQIIIIMLCTGDIR